MSKSPDAFRSIGEVSRLVGVAPHVLRYWESQFSQLSPVKRADGRRYYRPDDVRLAAGLCQVLREEGLSIRGAKRLITADRGAGLRKIGAARLGEALGDEAAPDRARPAVQLAVPASPAPADPAPQVQGTAPQATPSRNTAPEPASTAPAKPQAAPRRRRSTAADALPLFPDIDSVPPAQWLGRLAATAAALRLHEIQRNPLPTSAKDLREGLRAAR